MLRWGNRCLSKGKLPLLLKHTACKHHFHASANCDHSKQPVVTANMRYKLIYNPRSFGTLSPRSVLAPRCISLMLGRAAVVPI